MNKNLTEIVFIIDESGSMGGLESDTIGGFNSMLNKQKEEQGEAFVTTVFFANNSKIVHDRLDIRETPSLTNKDYCPGGCTALLDAMGETIEHIEKIHKYTKEADRPGQTIFIITTDGMENASRNYSSKKLKKIVEEKKEKGWSFIFLGANIDAIETAESFGIEKDMAVDFHNDSVGIQANYCCMSEAITSTRKHGKVKSSWKAAAEADYNSRK